MRVNTFEKRFIKRRGYFNCSNYRRFICAAFKNTIYVYIDELRRKDRKQNTKKDNTAEY